MLKTSLLRSYVKKVSDISLQRDGFQTHDLIDASHWPSESQPHFVSQRKSWKLHYFIRET